MASDPMTGARRILFKVSGEALARDGVGLDTQRLSWLADQIRAARASGPEIAIVVGAGNFVRGRDLADSGIERTTADYIGMLGTVMNAMALRDLLVARGVPARAMSAIPMLPAVENYRRDVAVAALGRGEVVLFGAGTGNPYFTTDTAAALRAVEIGADLLAKGTKVDGIYDKDPVLHQDARIYERLDYDQVLADRLGVMDATAVALCRENALPVLVFRLTSPDSLAAVAAGEGLGTLMS